MFRFNARSSHRHAARRKVLRSFMRVFVLVIAISAASWTYNVVEAEQARDIGSGKVRDLEFRAASLRCCPLDSTSENGFYVSYAPKSDERFRGRVVRAMRSIRADGRRCPAVSRGFAPHARTSRPFTTSSPCDQ